MRINEILIESQLNEEVLTELDWSKIKKGLATGAITLGALGVSGNAMAQHFKVDNASKIKDSQVVKYVQDKVDTGEIKPAVVKQAVQKVDAAPEIKKDEPKKAAPEVKSKAAEPKQDVKPEIKKDEPKTVKVDEPKPEIKKAAPDELDVVKKNAGVASTVPGSLSIKGLSFGMSLDQVLNVTQAKIDDRDAYRQAERDHYNKTKTYAGGPRMSDFKKSATDWSDAFEGFTIAGITGKYGWKPELDSEKRLAGLSNFTRSEQVEEALDIFTKQYGSPTINRFKSKTKGGLELNDFVAQWQVKDAVITMYKHIDRDTGMIKIQSKSKWEEETKRETEQRNKASKDF
jgi:hypothetical protein